MNTCPTICSSYHNHNISNSNSIYQAFNTSSSLLNYKAIRKMSISQQENLVPIPENIDNDIFNSKKKSDPNQIQKIENIQEIIEDDEYKDLAVIKRKFNNTFCAKSKYLNKEHKLTDKLKLINSFEVNQVFNLQSLKQKLSIYKYGFEKSKSNKKESKENNYNSNLDVSKFTYSTSKKLSENSNVKEYKELLKKSNEYECR